ncbi:MAG: 2'-5' RNA ligase family protein [Steroidobacteraceae bacterium]
MSTRRLFFALWPDQTMREALFAAIDGAAVGAVREGRPVPLANLHVTLAFLGSVPEAALASLIELAREVAVARSGEGRGVGAATRVSERSSAAIAMRLDRIEHWRRAEILCAAASRMPAGAEELSDALKSTLVAAGFRPDLKPFRAHVTLARQVRRAPANPGMQAVTWSFGEFALIESRTLPEGSSYSTVASWALCEEAPQQSRGTSDRA